MKCPHCGATIRAEHMVGQTFDRKRLFAVFDQNFEQMLERANGKQSIALIFAVMRAASAAIGRDSQDDLKDWLIWRETKQPGFLKSIEDAAT
jgi:hypothetical protein